MRSTASRSNQLSQGSICPQKSSQGYRSTSIKVGMTKTASKNACHIITASSRSVPRAPSLHAPATTKHTFQSFVTWAHGVVVSHPLRMRKALGSNPSVSTFRHACQSRCETPLKLLPRFELTGKFALPGRTLCQIAKSHGRIDLLTDPLL